MTRYDKLSTFDALTNIIYYAGYEYKDVCYGSKLRVKGECPADYNHIGIDSCAKCIKAWLMEEL